MAQITWRNVDAPNFSGALDGYRQFANMFSNGTSGLSDALGAYRKDQDNQNDQAILADALKLRSAPAIDQALQSGALLQGRTPTANASGKLIDLASGLVKDDTGKIDNTKAVTAFDRQQRDLTATDALRPYAALLAASPNAAARQTIMGAAVPALSQAPASAGFDLLANAQKGEAGNSTNLVGTTGANATVRNDADQQQAQAAIQETIRRGGGLDPSTALQYAESTPMSPGARAIFQQAFPAAYTGAVGGTPGVPGSANGLSPTGAAVSNGLAGGTPTPGGGTGSFSVAPGTAGHGTKAGSAFDMTVGGVATPKPLTQMTIAEAQDFGKKTLIPSNTGTMGNPPGVGSSAMGALQITGSTMADFAPKVFGDNWQNTVMTPDNQLKLGKAIFDARKDGNLKDTWTSLPDSKPGAYKDMTWEQVLPQITQGEVGGTPGAGVSNGAVSTPVAPQNPLTARANLTQLQNLEAGASVGSIAERGMQDNTGSVASKYVAAAQRIDADAGTVADELRAGPFKGTSRQFLLGQINKITQDGKVNPALAGEILRQNITAADRRPDSGPITGFLNLFNPGRVSENFNAGVRKMTPGNTANLADGQRLNDAGIKATIQQLRDSNSPILQQALANTQRQAKVEQVNTMKDNMQKAQDAVTMWSQRVNLQPGARDSLTRAQNTLAQATSAFNAARAETMSDPAYNPTGRKAPVSVSTPASAEEQMNKAILGAW